MRNGRAGADACKEWGGLVWLEGAQASRMGLHCTHRKPDATNPFDWSVGWPSHPTPHHPLKPRRRAEWSYGTDYAWNGAGVGADPGAGSLQ